MKIKKVPYPVHGKYKFYVEHNGNKYTCYIQSGMENLVVTGYATHGSTDHEEVTDMKLKSLIICNCYNKK